MQGTRPNLVRSCRFALTLLFALAVAAAILPGVARAATYNTWTKQTSGTTSTLYGVYFTDASNGWIAGSGGVIRHTTNGGTTWSAQTSSTTQNLRGVYFVNSQEGWAVGNGGTLLRTLNGGTTWTAQTSGTTQNLRAVCFTSANTGWIVGSGGTIRRTLNGSNAAGSTWTTQTSGTGSTLYGVRFSDANNGWVVGSGGLVRHTANGSNAGGSTWAAQTSGTTQTLYGLYVADASNGWVVGNRGTIRHTVNGGTAWSAQTSGISVTIYGTTFKDATTGWAVGGSGSIRRTTNGGTAWAAQTSGTTQTLYGLVFAGGSAWACGGGGVVLTSLVDTTPPVTGATGLQADNHSGWRAAGQTVTLTATDAQSGVSATCYTIDGGAQQTYAAPFTVSAQGSHTIVYWSVDRAANTEARHTDYVNIDATAPATTATGLQTSASAGWQTTGQTVTLTATDAYSGVATTTYTIDGVAHLYSAPFLVAGNGSHAVTYLSTDGAGNAEALHTGYVNIDTTAPVTTPTGLQANASSGWQNVSQVVSLAGSDGLSGVAATYYTLDGGARQTYASPFTVFVQGSHTVTYWSVDTIGNTETTKTGYVNIDLAAPAVGDDANGAWHNSAVTVHLSPTDTGGSGLASTQYRLQTDSTWSAAAGNAFVVPAPPDGSGDGARVYQYRALDNAGNSSTIRSCTLWIDATAPVTTPTGLAADDLSDWRTTSQTVSLSADDGVGSGVTSVSYAVDGGA
ncbi:MAG: WD40/YVTN/BNR-like repeat-containing protein, partial [Thermoleophilia bacterium]